MISPMLDSVPVASFLFHYLVVCTDCRRAQSRQSAVGNLVFPVCPSVRLSVRPSAPGQVRVNASLRGVPLILWHDLVRWRAHLCLLRWRGRRSRNYSLLTVPLLLGHALLQWRAKLWVSAPEGRGLLPRGGSKKTLTKFDITFHLAKLKILLPFRGSLEIPTFCAKDRSRLRGGAHSSAKISLL